MEIRKEAILMWLASVIDREIGSINELKDCAMIQDVLGRIEGFTFEPRSAETEAWKGNYKKMRSIYEQLESYFRDTLKTPFPSNISIMNMVEMAKGESDQGLQSLLHLLFIVCIQCPIKQDFITCIFKLPNSAQQQLMRIIQESSPEKDDNETDDQIKFYKDSLENLTYQYNTIANELQSLRDMYQEEYTNFKQNEQQIASLKKENNHLMREINEKNELLRQKQETLMDRFSDQNDDLLEELKKTMIQRQQYYNRQISKLKQNNQNLNEMLSETKKINSQLYEEKNTRQIHAVRDDHTNCISIQKHKAKVTQLLSQSKQLTKKQMTMKLQNLKLTNLNAELQGRNRKLMDQNRKRQEQFLINSEDGSKLKIEFFMRIRDSLKKRLDEYKIKDNKGSDNKIDFLDD